MKWQINKYNIIKFTRRTYNFITFQLIKCVIIICTYCRYLYIVISNHMLILFLYYYDVLQVSRPSGVYRNNTIYVYYTLTRIVATRTFCANILLFIIVHPHERNVIALLEIPNLRRTIKHTFFYKDVCMYSVVYADCHFRRTPINKSKHT